MNTTEQESAVGDALRGMLKSDSTADEPVAARGSAPGVLEEDPEVAEDAASTEAETPESEPEQETAATDDVAALRTALAEREADVKRYEERLLAVNDRNRQNLDTLNQRALRMATQRDRARQVLEKALSAEGVDKAEAERLLSEIRSGYNAQSTNYQAPEQPQAAPDDDRAVDGNQWLNDRGLTQAESESLGTYIRGAQLTQREQRLAQSDIYSFLTLLEPRWRESAKAAPATDATKAAVTVARVQKQAAKAASAGLGAAAATNAGKPTPRKKAALSDDQVSALIKQVWEDR